ncbi:hypothetical protein BKN38_03160 [Helicobacter sp. CLO-3]|uniref:hypothetical protein n=1 Tax=unclassified Helicobacter TaxID=2593540 RepID=UPI000804A4ED|nr:MULTISPECIES: hypothetical protein [unclassified Helicobacter]OBV29290.1 hypothetical protein BA723_06080 [Helicobacter sp. CLO-3]OHU84463.1 hypothetical protein BKN38_03160 [Helicobacter sp. CLO-3]
MKIFIIALIAFAIFMVSACTFTMPLSAGDRELERITNEYGGSFVTNKEYAEQLKKREDERDKAGIRFKIEGSEKKLKNGSVYFIDSEALDKEFPPALPNGYKYGTKNDLCIVPKDVYEFYKSKIKEYMGDEAFKRLEPYLIITSTYTDNDGNCFPLTIYTRVRTVVTIYGLSGDEGAGIRLKSGRIVSLGGDEHFHYLINDKFVKGEKMRENNTIIRY